MAALTWPYQITNVNTHSSRLWKQLPAADRMRLLEGEDAGKEDGEFWMSFDDFKKHFTDFEICSISVDQMYEDEKGQRSKCRGDFMAYSTFSGATYSP